MILLSTALLDLSFMALFASAFGLGVLSTLWAQRQLNKPTASPDDKPEQQ